VRKLGYQDDVDQIVEQLQEGDLAIRRRVPGPSGGLPPVSKLESAPKRCDTLLSLEMLSGPDVCPEAAISQCQGAVMYM
jgi:hypothetical protein